MKMSVTEFKSQCTRVLREVGSKPSTVEVTKRGKVVAVVSPSPSPARKDPARFFGSLAGTATEAGDIVAPAVPAKDWDAAR
jgi:prevent-host-death family protein